MCNFTVNLPWLKLIDVLYIIYLYLGTLLTVITVVSRASAHSRVSTQVLVLAAQMDGAHSLISTQARFLQSRMASTQAALACQHAKERIQARSTKHSYTKAWLTIIAQLHCNKQLNCGSRVTNLV